MSRARTGRAARADPALRRQHTREAIGRRLAGPPATSHLRDFIYGAIDGAVTTFAIVAGADPRG